MSNDLLPEPCPLCFPDGLGDEYTSAGCGHGSWIRVVEEGRHARGSVRSATQVDTVPMSAVRRPSRSRKEET
jgi:hypothetical protein